MRPKICKDNGVNIPTSDCSTCEVLEAKVDALTEELENKQNVLTAGDHIVIEEDVISADLSDYYDKVAVDTMVNGINGVSFLVVDTLPETGDSRTIYLVSNGDGYDQYVYTNNTWTDIGATSTANVQNVYPITGATEFSANWLSLTDGGTAITPSQGIMYILVKGSETVGVGNILRWDGTTYKVVSDAGVVKGDYDASNNARLVWQGGRLNPNKTTYALKLTSDGTLTADYGGVQVAEYEKAGRVPKDIVARSDTFQIASGTLYQPTWGSSFTATGWGLFLGTATAVFSANATGQRWLDVKLDDIGINCWEKVQTASAGETVLSIPILAKVATGEQVKVGAWQNSGSTLGVAISMRGMFIYD